jgi:hypothetical protein
MKVAPMGEAVGTVCYMVLDYDQFPQAQQLYKAKYGLLIEAKANKLQTHARGRGYLQKNTDTPFWPESRRPLDYHGWMKMSDNLNPEMKAEYESQILYLAVAPVTMMWYMTGKKMTEEAIPHVDSDGIKIVYREYHRVVRDVFSPWLGLVV